MTHIGTVGLYRLHVKIGSARKVGMFWHILQDVEVPHI
jgi:hypothetical protein